MISLETFVTFFTASVLLGLAPGPDNVFVLTQSAMFGRLAGFMVVLGLCTGLIVHTAGVAFGVAVLFQTSVLAFSVLKILGTCYLLYLAWKSFRASREVQRTDELNKVSFGVLYRRGVIMNISNPKVSIFFLAFLPQFAAPEKGSVTFQFFLLGSLFILSTLIVFGLIAILAGTLGDWFKKSEKAQKILNRIAGIVFIGIALKLATTQQ